MRPIRGVVVAVLAGVAALGASPAYAKRVAATQVSTGGFHTCAVLSSGHVDCWGGNRWGELGDGSTNNSDTAIEVQGVSNATQVGAGSWHTCALLSSGRIDCWGENQYGQLADGTYTGPEQCEYYGSSQACSTAPVELPGVTNATQLAAGAFHTCAVLLSGTVDCWGRNEHGQLGDGTTENSDTPVEVQGISNATQISAGTFHTCALLSTGDIDCWGENEHGQLGSSVAENSDTPVEVQGISTATQLSAGGWHTCALLVGGHIDCWGFNGFGELGNGSITNSDTPVEVQGISNATQVSAGGWAAGSEHSGSHTCALLATARIDCWGENYYGQLGDGQTLETVDTPVEVRAISSATAVSAGGSHTCALVSRNHVECWGDNGYGDLGNGHTNKARDKPVNVRGL